MIQSDTATIRAHQHAKSDKRMPSSSHNTSHTAFPGFAAQALSACIRGYQVLLSPVFGTQCRFYPTCSHYALDAIARHGAGKGLLLSAGRIVRCNPLCEGGHDPVPERFSFVKLNS
jgi:putative membrane protein insertion efficiency factor